MQKRRRCDPWVGKVPWRRAWQAPPVFLPGESHGLGSQGVKSRGVSKSRTQQHRDTQTPKVMSLAFFLSSLPPFFLLACLSSFLPSFLAPSFPPSVPWKQFDFKNRNENKANESRRSLLQVLHSEELWLQPPSNQV